MSLKAADGTPHLDDVRARLDPVEVERLAARLVASPSWGPETGWEAPVASILEDVCQAAGLTVREQPIGQGRRNLLAVLPGEAEGPALLLLNGHMDTVPPSAQMTRPPFAAVVEDGRLWGRGAADMKGGLAAMTCALVALRRSGFRPPSPVVLTAVAAEETGNLGTAALVRAGPPARAAVVGEPTRLHVVTAHKGVDRYRVTVRGRAAHGSTPERGVNAIVQAARVIVAIEERLRDAWAAQRHPLLGTATLNIGTIRGGISRNAVPDRCVFQVEKRWLPGDAPESIRADLERVIQETIGCGWAEVAREPEFERIPHPPLDLPRDHPLVGAALAALGEVRGVRPTLAVLPAFTDAALLQAAGTPTIVCGPGDLAVAHADDEHVPTAELYDAALAYAALALILAEEERRGRRAG